MVWMPHSTVKTHILQQLDKLCATSNGSKDFQSAIAGLGPNDTLDQILNTLQSSTNLVDLDPINKPGEKFKPHHIDHVREHWFGLGVVSDNDGRALWNSGRANRAFKRGLKIAIDEAVEREVPLNITWCCPGRGNPNAEVLIIKTDIQINALLVTPRRWWDRDDLNALQQADIAAEMDSDAEFLEEIRN